MPSIDRQLRANRTVLLAPIVDVAGVPQLVGPDGSICPFSAPTAAVLDGWRQVKTTTATGASHGGNISEALLDTLSLGLAASATNSDLTIVSVGNEVSVSYKNVNATLDGLRDASKAGTGVFNLYTHLVVGADVRYAIVDRIGYDHDAAFAVGQIVSLYEVHTDVPLDQKADRANLKLQQAAVPSGEVNSNYAIAA